MMAMMAAILVFSGIGLVVGELAERVITRFFLIVIFKLKKSNSKFKQCNHQWSTISSYSLAYTHDMKVMYCPCCDTTLNIDSVNAKVVKEKSQIKKQYTDSIMKNIEKELLKAKIDLEKFKEYNEILIENSYNSNLEKSLKGYDN